MTGQFCFAAQSQRHRKTCSHVHRVAMSRLFPPQIVITIALLLVVSLAGCSHQKTKRGHLFRGDWAVEYNRTPWIGCPPDSGYSDEEDAENRSLFSCLAKDGKGKSQKRFRHHCAQNAQCSPKEPCCRTLGCGMWVDPNDPAMNATLGGAAKACGLLPFCSPQKPCCLTPNCGRPVNVNVNPQTLMLANQNAGMPGRNPLQGIFPGNADAMQNGVQNGMQNGTGTIRGMNPAGTIPNGLLPNGITPNAVLPNGMLQNGMLPNGMAPNGMSTMHGGTVGAVQGTMSGAMPGATLVSRGIVPGASAITSGGMVAAIGVATPAGMMTATGVRLPNGMVNNAIVLRACTMTQNCTAARPCGLAQNCGGAVAVNMVANNATVLASALQAQGVAGGVMQANGMSMNGMGMNGMGMLVNPMTNQPIAGLTMGGYPQAGYPPIGYAPTGYAPGYPRFAAGMVDTGEIMEEQEQQPEEVIAPSSETRSKMPMPRFHPIPSQPAFQRSEGMPSAPRAVSQQPTAMTGQRGISEQELESALDQAYLEGVAAAMDEVERKLEAKRQAVARAKLEEKILLQAEYVQQQLEAQEEMRMLAIQRERQLQQLALRQQQVAQEPPRLPPPNAVAVARPTPQPSPTQPNPMISMGNFANVNAVQLAGNLKTSIFSGVNEIVAPLLGTNQASPTQQRGQAPATPQPRQRQNTVQNTTQPVELAKAQPAIPVKPPVLRSTLNYGLLDDESESGILQAKYSDDGAAIRP